MFDLPVPSSDFAPVTPALDIPRGTRIGHYLVEKRIGAGGMADVFSASQERPSRKVALKVMRGGLSERAIKRFQFEAEVLGKLTHPAIAQVFDAGETQVEGATVPYIAMEYVDGAQDILCYANEKALDRGQRLDLFLQFAEAIQYGHENAVLHRDIKPSNLLVSGSGHAKVIDYGIARAEIGQEADHTRTGEVFGTIGYLAPERLRGDLGADIRSEVYSMGVVLFELITGECPIDLKGLSFVDAVERVQRHEPRRASSVLAGTPEGLDWIGLKALAIDRERRYASIGDMTLDIRRFLRGESVLAGAPSKSYRMRSWLRRNRVLTALVLLTVVGTGATVVGTRIGLQRAERQAQIAKDQTAIAERQTQLAVEKTLLAREQTKVAERQAIIAQDQTAIAEQQSLLAKEKTLLAQEQTRVAEHQSNLSEATFSILEKTLQNANHQAGGVDARLSTVLGLIDSEIEGRFAKEPEVAIRMDALLASAYLGSGDLKQAKRIMARLEGKPGGRPKDLAVLAGHRAYILQLEGDLKGAESAFRLLLDSTPVEGSVDHREFRLEMVRALTGTLLSQGRAKEALDYAQSEIEHAAQDLSVSARSTLQRYLGDAQRMTGNPAGGLESIETAIELARTKSHAKYELITALRSAGLTAINLGNTTKAQTFLREATELAEDFLGHDHPDTAVTAQVTSTLYMRMGEYEQAIEAIERLMAMPAYLKLPTRSKAGTEDTWVYALSVLGRGEEALEAAEKMIESSVSMLDPGDPTRLACEGSYAQALIAADQLEKALQVMEGITARATEFHGATSRTTIISEHNLMSGLMSAGQYERVLAMAEAQIEFLTGKVSPNGTMLWNTHQAKVESLFELGHFDDCQAAIDRVRVLMDLKSAPRHERYIDTTERQVHEALKAQK
ncbi:MAG: protein kinase [Planctomycetes bacterium]|nr:protein kinase [Planctomycetota bacterium]